MATTEILKQRAERIKMLQRLHGNKPPTRGGLRRVEELKRIEKELSLTTSRSK